MRIYADVMEAVREIERDMFEMGVKSHSRTHQNHVVEDDAGFESKELIGYSFGVGIPENIINNSRIAEALSYMGKTPDLSFKYCVEEVLDRIAGSANLNPGTSWENFPELWSSFMTAGKFDYTYYERFQRYDNFNAVVEELISNLSSRRAVLSIWDTSLDVDLRRETGRVPCSMYYQFLVRKIRGVQELCIIYNMRSCDLYEHFVHDIVMAMLIANHVASCIRTQTGVQVSATELIFQAGSFHMFAKDYDKREIF